LFKCAQAFSESGIEVFFFIGPVLPKVTLQDLDSILNLIKESGARTIMADRLRLDKSFASWNIKQNLLTAYQNASIYISLDDKICEEEFKIAKNKIIDFCNKNNISFQE
jgi:DNA repair photolyase